MTNPHFTDPRTGRRIEMPYALKERPHCRRAILQMCRDRGLTLTELLAEVHAYRVLLSDGLTKQLRKMVYEDYENEQRRRGQNF
jgi:hypothetical protein